MKNILEMTIKKLKLGTALIHFEPLLGGAIHKMWKVETEHGHFAIKEINDHITEKPTFLESYEISEQISDLLHQNGIPSVSALKINNHYLHEISSKWFIVYPFVIGKITDIDQLKRSQIEKIGNIFAQIHALKLNLKGVDTAYYDLCDNKHWTNLINLAQISELNTLLPKILSWNDQYKNSIEFLNQNLVITHRDLHHLNVLWDAQSQPHVIDWESAGLMNPLLEIIGYGFEWGDIISGSFQADITKTVLESYREKSNTKINQSDIRHAFYGWIGHCILGWTEFNLRRMVGKTSSNPEEAKIGSDIINQKMKKCISYLSENEDKMIDIVCSVFK